MKGMLVKLVAYSEALCVCGDRNFVQEQDGSVAGACVDLGMCFEMSNSILRTRIVLQGHHPRFHETAILMTIRMCCRLHGKFFPLHGPFKFFTITHHIGVE